MIHLHNGYASDDSDIEPPRTSNKISKTKRHRRKRVYRYYNGNIRRIAKYKNGKLHGRQLHYFLNGKCSTLRTYHRGKQVGLKINYHDNGRINEISMMGNKTIMYDSNGSIKFIDTICKSESKERTSFISFYVNKQIQYIKESESKHGNLTYFRS